MRIAIFDYRTLPTNPTGGCVLKLLAGLCHEHEFTVFSPAFDNPAPERIVWVRIPVPRRPLALVYLSFHLAAPICYLWHLLRTRKRFDLVQIAESNLLFGKVVYSQFCHRAFLKNHWAAVRPTGLRGRLRWLDHWMHALLEPIVYARCRRAVTASRGLTNEIAKEYPRAASKLVVVSNPVDVERMRCPPGFDRQAFRAHLGIRNDETVLVFCALGHFERKGLGLLLKALERFPKYPWRLLVVGGEPDAINSYRNRSSAKVIYTGMQSDIRPFLWISEAFAFPSAYEAFSLVTLEAAAAALPLLVPAQLNGTEEFLRNGENGLTYARDVDGVEAALNRFFGMVPAERLRMGQQAQADVAVYQVSAFIDNWRRVYREIEKTDAAEQNRRDQRARAAEIPNC